MSDFCWYTFPPLGHHRTRFPLPHASRTQWHNSGHYQYLPPIHSVTTSQYPIPQPYLLMTGSPRGVPHGYEEHHHHYSGLSPVLWSNYTLGTYPGPHINPVPVASSPLPSRPPRLQCQAEAHWPEGFTLRGELHWGRLERVYGPRRELPGFVREDLRRVYGTYPRTDLSITYHRGEYVVKADPHVAEQEYKVERRVIRQDKSPEEAGGVRDTRKRKKRRNLR